MVGITRSKVIMLYRNVIILHTPEDSHLHGSTIASKMQSMENSMFVWVPHIVPYLHSSHHLRGCTRLLLHGQHFHETCAEAVEGQSQGWNINLQIYTWHIAYIYIGHI